MPPASAGGTEPLIMRTAGQRVPGADNYHCRSHPLSRGRLRDGLCGNERPCSLLPVVVVAGCTSA